MLSENIEHARLYFLIARDSQKAVIFRRRPSEWTQIISWDLKTDVLHYGQRFHGRIYEMRSDISPDGEFLIYFAAKYGKTNKEGYANTWTAVSRLPCLTALAMWPLGHTWYGGGFFKENHEIILNHINENANAHPNHPPRKNWLIHAHENREFISSDYLYQYILRNHGWETLKAETDEHILQKINSEYQLEWKRNFVNFKSVETFSIIDKGQRHILENIQHADCDHAGRFLFAKQGCLYITEKNRPPYDAGSWKMIADLNGELPFIGKAPAKFYNW